MSGISGVSGAGPIWHHFMRTVLRGQPALDFARPARLVQVEVCSLSGLLPTPDCPYIRREWFIEGTQPSRHDDLYQRVVLDAATGQMATDATPVGRRIERVFLDLPPQARAWAQAAGVPLLPDALAVQAAAPSGEAPHSLLVLSPDRQTVFRISPTLPLDAQKIRITIAGPGELRDVTIYLDDVPLATLHQPPFEMLWTLQAGQHVLYATGIMADGEELRSEIVAFTVKPAE
jgi:hypothetical protein